jgi:hypothetical protein
MGAGAGQLSALCYGRPRMKSASVVCLLAASLVVTGCSAVSNAVREVLGFGPQADPSVTLRSAEPRWLLVKNPRFGDVASEPQYIWVEEDKVPTTITTLIRGEKAIIAAPEIVARYGPPPGSGKISPRQGIAIPTDSPAAAASDRVATARAVTAGGTNGKATASVKQGVVLFVDTTRVAVDLTATDGVRVGTVLSVRRDRVPIVHPVTGEVLGDLDEEVGTARITEVRDKFSVAELQTVAPGASVQVKDRVVAK